LVTKKKLLIRWDKGARDALKDIYDYISLDSVAQAKKVKAELLHLVRSLSDYPEKYSIEPYLEEETGNYRSVAKWSYKIIYEVTEKEIIIAMVFHAKQDPSKISKKK
jgi:plasmid stabilization system protein ParE